MAATLTILKLTNISAVCSISGTGAATIALATDLLKAGETAATPKVDIKAIWGACVSGTGNTIVRNSHTLWDLTNIPFHFQFDGWNDNRDRTSDIVVTLGASGGTIILELIKKDGYGLTQQVANY